MTKETVKKLTNKLANLPTEELDKAFDLFEEVAFDFENDLSIFKLNEKLLKHFIEEFNFNAEELKEFFNPINDLEFEDEIDELLELL